MPSFPAWPRLLVVLVGLTTACAQAPSAVAPPTPAPTAAATRQPTPPPTSAPAATPVVPKVNVSYGSISASQLPLWVADEAGLLRQNGLDADVKFIASTTGVAALLSGQTDIGQFGGSEALSAAANGADLVILGTLTPVYPYLMMVPADVTTRDELKGAKLGVSGIGAADDVALRVSLTKLGLDPDKDVVIVKVGSGPEKVAAQLSGAVVGAVQQPQDALVLQDKGFHALFDLAELNLPAALVCVVTTRVYLAAHRDVAQRYVDAIVEGRAKEAADPAFTLEVMKKYLQTGDEAGLRATYDYFMRIQPVYPYPKAEQFTDSVQVLSATNEKVRGFDVAKLLDPTFVQSAADRRVGGG